MGCPSGTGNRGDSGDRPHSLDLATDWQGLGGDISGQTLVEGLRMSASRLGQTLVGVLDLFESLVLEIPVGDRPGLRGWGQTPS